MANPINIAKPTVYIDALLASGQHAILQGKDTIEISQSFDLFYTDKEVDAARNLLSELDENHFKKRRVSNKKRDLAEVLTYIRQEDWKGRNLVFGVVDISRICQVTSGLQDEIQLRSELQIIKSRMDALTSVVDEIRTISKTVSDAAEAIKKGAEHHQQPNQTSTYVQVAKKNLKSDSNKKLLHRGRPLPSPPMSQKIAIKKNNEPLSSDVENESNCTTPTNEFKVVTKKKRKPRPIVLGSSQSTEIKIIRKPKVGILFMSRCAPDTTQEEITTHITKSEIKYKLSSVEKCQTRHSSYSSFKICFEIGESKLSAFLKDILNPTFWPSGALVRRFNLSRPSTSMS